MTLAIVLCVVVLLMFFYVVYEISVHWLQEADKPPIRQPLGRDNGPIYFGYSGGDAGSCSDGGGGGGCGN